MSDSQQTTGGQALTLAGEAVNIIGAIKGMRDRNVEKARQERNDRFNRQMSKRSLQNQIMFNTPSYRASLAKQAGFNPAVINGLAETSAPANAPQVANNPMDFSSIPANISSVGQSMSTLGQDVQRLALERSRTSYDNQMKELEMKTLVSQWCNDPSSFSNFVRSNGGSVDYTLPNGNSLKIKEIDGKLMFESDSEIPEFLENEKFFEWSEKDGKFYSPLPFTSSTFSNSLLNLVNGYSKVFGLDNVKANTFNANSSAIVSQQNAYKLMKDLKYYERDKLLGYLSELQRMSFVELQKRSVELDNEFKDSYERQVKEYEAKLAKHGLNTSDSIFLRIIAVGGKDALKTLIQKAMLQGEEALDTVINAYLKTKKKYNKAKGNSEQYSDVDKLIMKMFYGASGNGGSF